MKVDELIDGSAEELRGDAGLQTGGAFGALEFDLGLVDELTENRPGPSDERKNKNALMAIYETTTNASKK